MHEIEIIIDIKFQPAKPKGSSIQEKMFRYVSKVQNIKPHPMAPNRSGVKRLTIARKLWKIFTITSSLPESTWTTIRTILFKLG